MEIGDIVLVYNQVRKQSEICEFGEKHSVPIYEVKRIRIVDVRQEKIIALHYTHDGVGSVYYAKDAQGRMYRKQDHWDGPRASFWSRGAGDYRKTFTQYPSRRFSRDITGRSLNLELR